MPTCVKHILDQHIDELRSILASWQGCAIGGFTCAKPAKRDWLPGYMIKYGIERVYNAEKLKSFVRYHKLHLVEVPRKYIYRIVDDSSRDCNDRNSLVIVEEIQHEKVDSICLNLQQLKQLYYITISAPYYDMHRGNYITADDGKIYIIDTDCEAMPCWLKAFSLKIHWLLYGNSVYDNGSLMLASNPFNDPVVKLKLSMYPNGEDSQNSENYQWLSTTLKHRETWRKRAAGCIWITTGCCALSYIFNLHRLITRFAYSLR